VPKPSCLGENTDKPKTEPINSQTCIKISMSELLSWGELDAKDQILEFITPNNIIKDCQCPICHANFTCTADFRTHKTVCSPLSPADLDKLPWQRYSSGEGEWSFSSRAPDLKKMIQYGNTRFGAYNYQLSGNGTFISRKKA